MIGPTTVFSHLTVLQVTKELDSGLEQTHNNALPVYRTSEIEWSS